MRKLQIFFKERLPEFAELLKEFFIDLYEKISQYAVMFLIWFVKSLPYWVFTLVVIGVVSYTLTRGDEPLSNREIRFILLGVLASFVLTSVSLLRLYNAVVVNSSYLLKLRSEIRGQRNTYQELSRSISTLRATMEKANDAMRSVQKAAGSLEGSIDQQKRSMMDLGTHLKNSKR